MTNRKEKERLHHEEACNLIKAHHITMQDDPEHLSTKFIENVMGKKCKLTDAELLAKHEQFMKHQKQYGRYVDPDYEDRKKKSSKTKPKRKIRKCKK